MNQFMQSIHAISNTRVPPPSMPRLPFERNTMHLMGSYLSHLAENLQYVLPFMTRCGDLLQRESLITDPLERQQLQKLANQVGECLDQIAKCSGSVGHLYRGVEIRGVGQAQVHLDRIDPVFEQVVQRTNVIRRS
jgi:hypothetical protein